MSTMRLLGIAAVSVTVLSLLISIIALIDMSLSAVTPALLVDNLGRWVKDAGYHLALIILATTATLYLAKK